MTKNIVIFFVFNYFHNGFNFGKKILWSFVVTTLNLNTFYFLLKNCFFSVILILFYDKT